MRNAQRLSIVFMTSTSPFASEPKPMSEEAGLTSSTLVKEPEDDKVERGAKSSRARDAVRSRLSGGGWPVEGKRSVSWELR